MTGRLGGKVAIVTGASTGLGPALGALFVREGAKVLLAARREELVRDAARAVSAGAIAMRADVTDENDVAAMVSRAVDEFGHVDVLCNNAAASGQDRWIWEQTHYVTAKASLRAFTKAVALEVGSYGIRCNCIVPGTTDTKLWRGWVRRTAEEQQVDFATQRARILKGVALQDISLTEDVANLAVDAGGYMQG